MTDNEIIKALECCKKPLSESNCKECAFYHSGRCSLNMLNAVLDLINRQKAEIERLKKNIDGLNIFTKNHIKVIRLQAIKEFAKQVKMAFYYEFDELIPSIMADKIDSLVKEMMEVNENE